MSRQPSARASRRKRPYWPRYNQWCGKSATAPASARRWSGNRTTRRPRRLTASATANGRLPPPQMIASGLSSALESESSCSIEFHMLGRALLARGARLHQRTASSVSNERDDPADDRVVFKFAHDHVDSVSESAFAVEEDHVGPAQPVDLDVGDAEPPQPHAIEANEP